MLNILYIICKTNEHIISISQDDLIIKTNTYFIQNNNNVLINGILNILQQCNINITKLNNIVISTNPQTYTGTRVIYSFLAGLTFSSNIKVINIKLLELYLRTAKKLVTDIKDKYFCILLEAKNNNFYAISEINDQRICYGKYSSEFLENELKKYKNVVLFIEKEKRFSNSNYCFIKNFNDIELINSAYNMFIKTIKENNFIDFNNLDIEYL